MVTTVLAWSIETYLVSLKSIPMVLNLTMDMLSISTYWSEKWVEVGENALVAREQLQGPTMWEGKQEAVKI